MDGGINRRKALGIIAGGTLTALSSTPTDAADKLEVLGSSLTAQELEHQKSAAARQLIDSFWNEPRARDHIAKHFFSDTQDRQEMQRTLEEEAKMFIPSADQIQGMGRKYQASLIDLSKHIPEKKYGLLLAGDEQVLYLLEKVAGKMKCVKGYPVSTSREGWGNKLHSGGTPLGLHFLAEGRRGMLGEVVANSRREWKNYAHFSMKENGQEVSKTIVGSLFDKTNTVPEVITSSFLVVGPSTPPTRAIFIHGTNRLSMLGRPDSGGCIRLSNVDVYDIGQYIDVEMGKLLQYGKKMPIITSGTPLMIATAQQQVPSITRTAQKMPESPSRKEAGRSRNVPQKPIENLLDDKQWKKHLETLRKGPNPKK